jgi:hypothetical protein
MLMDAIERVANDKAVAHLSVEESLDPQMIACAEEPLLPAVPNGVDKIAEQMFHAPLTPGVVSVQNQLGVGSIQCRGASPSGQLGDQCRPIIDARIRGDPDSSIQAAWLLLTFRFPGGAQQRVAETDGPIDPSCLSIRTPKSQERRHLGKQLPIDGRPIQVPQPNNPAHRATPPAGTSARANAAKRS